MIIIRLLSKEYTLKRHPKTNERKLSLLISREIVKELKEGIYKQKFNWAPLNDRYLKQKLEKGLDTRTWIARGELVKSIGVVFSRGNYYITFRRKYDSEGKEFLKIARSLEYGTDKIPARPLFKPTVEKIERRLKKLGVLQ